MIMDGAAILRYVTSRDNSDLLTPCNQDQRTHPSKSILRNVCMAADTGVLFFGKRNED